MIVYVGRHLLGREAVSVYDLGYVSFHTIKEFGKIVDEWYTWSYDLTDSVINHRLLEKYLTMNYVKLGAWLRESQIPFGGIVDRNSGKVYILFTHNSIHEMAFRLVWSEKISFNPTDDDKRICEVIIEGQNS